MQTTKHRTHNREAQGNDPGPDFVASHASALPQSAAAVDRDKFQQARRAESDASVALLQERDSLLRAVVEASRELLSSADFCAGLHRALLTIQAATRSDRVYVLRHEPAQAAVFILDELCVAGIPSTVSINGPGPYAASDFAEVFRALLADQVYSSPIVEKTGANADLNNAVGTKSDLMVPIFVGGEFWGLIGFDDCREARTYQPAEIQVLRGVAAAIGAALARAQSEAALLAAEQQRVREAVELNRVLESVVEASRRLIAADDFDAALAGWLEALALAVEADAAGFGSFAPHEAGEVALIKKAWSRLSREPSPATPIPATTDFIAFTEKLSAGEAIVAHRDELCDPASVRFLESFDVFSDLIVPICGDTQVVGWVSFNWAQRHELTPAHVAALRTAANGAASALERHEVRQAMLVEREQRLLAERARAETSERLTALLAVVVSSARELIDAPEFEPALLRWLGRFAEATDAIRATYYDQVIHAETGLLTVRMLSEWVRAGVAGSIPVSFASPYVIDPRGAEEVMSRLTSGQQVVVHTEDMREPMRSFLIEQGNVSVIAVPVFMNGRQTGCVSFDFATRQEPIPAILAVLQTAADTLATVIRRNEAMEAALAERERAAAARLEATENALAVLRTGTTTLARVPDLNQFLAKLMQEMLRQIEGWNAQLFLYDPKTDTLCASLGINQGEIVLSAPGLVVDLPVSQSFPAHITGAWRRLLQARGAIYFDLERDAADFWPGTVEWHRERGHKGAVCIALRLGKEPLGMLGFVCPGKETFAEEEFSMLSALAEQASLAIAVSRLADQAKNAAMAVERQQAAQRRVAELAAANLALARATAGLVGGLDAATFLCSLQVETTAITGAKTSGIFTYDENTERLRMFALMSSGVPIDITKDPRMEVWRQDVPLSVSRRWIEQIRSGDFATFDNHTAPDQHPWPISRKWHEMMGHRYIITVPLYVGQRMIGTFGQCFSDGYDVTRFDFPMTRVLANHAALALQLTQLADEARQAAIIREQEINTRRHLTEVEQFNLALQRTTSLLAQGMNLREFLGQVLTECLEMVGADFAHILTYNPADDSLSFAVGARPGRVYLEALPEEPEMFRQPMPASSFPIFSFLRAEQRVALLSQDAKDAPPPEPIARWFAAEGIHEVTGLLLAVGEEPVGFVGMAFRTEKPLPPQKIKLFQALANQAALAIAMSRLGERSRIAAVLDERARLAGQIHDTLAQQFTGTLLHLEALSTRADRGYRVTPEDLQTVRKIAAFGLAEARRSALNLRPLELDSGTLADALQHLAERSRVAGLLECDFSCSGTTGRMAPEHEEALLCIAHEAVNNAIRHGEASRIQICLKRKSSEIKLFITDDGRGFDHSQARQQGRTFGLRSMESRALSIGSAFEVASSPGQGTIVTVRMPIR